MCVNIFCWNGQPQIGLAGPRKITTLKSQFENSGIFLNLWGKQFEMQSIVTLVNEIPLIMAPAALIAAMIIISAIE